MTAIVGLYSPWPQSGKSTVADQLLSYAIRSEGLSFADPMRQLVQEFAGIFMEGGEDEAFEWMTSSKKDTAAIPFLGVTFRHLLQTLGTEWGRKCVHPDVWVKVAQARLRNEAKRNSLIVFDDLRFENEHAMLRKEGATLIRVYRPGAEPEKQHESNERLESLPFDYVITNDGSKGKLKRRVAEIAEGILG